MSTTEPTRADHLGGVGGNAAMNIALHYCTMGEGMAEVEFEGSGHPSALFGDQDNMLGFMPNPSETVLARFNSVTRLVTSTFKKRRIGRGVRESAWPVTQSMSAWTVLTDQRVLVHHEMASSIGETTVAALFKDLHNVHGGDGTAVNLSISFLRRYAQEIRLYPNMGGEADRLSIADADAELPIDQLPDAIHSILLEPYEGDVITSFSPDGEIASLPILKVTEFVKQWAKGSNQPLVIDES